MLTKIKDLITNTYVNHKYNLNRINSRMNNSGDEDDILVIFLSVFLYSFVRWISSYFFDSFWFLNTLYWTGIIAWVVYCGIKGESSLNNIFQKYFYESTTKVLNKIINKIGTEHLFKQFYEKEIKNNLINLYSIYLDFSFLSNCINKEDFVKWISENKSNEILEHAKQLNIENTTTRIRKQLLVYSQNPKNKNIILLNNLTKIIHNKLNTSYLSEENKKIYFESDFHRYSPEELCVYFFNSKNKSLRKIARRFLNGDDELRISFIRACYYVPKYYKIENIAQFLKHSPQITHFQTYRTLCPDFEKYIHLLFKNTSFENFEFIFSSLKIEDLRSYFDRVRDICSSEDVDAPPFKNKNELIDYLNKLQYQLQYKGGSKTINHNSNFEWLVSLDNKVIGNSRIEVLKTDDDYLKWGNRLRHCIGNGSYSKKALEGKGVGLGIYVNKIRCYNIFFDRDGVEQVKGYNNKDFKKEWNLLVNNLCKLYPEFNEHRYRLLSQ